MLMLKCFVALALWAPILVTARECTSDEPYGSYNISSPEEAADLFAGCTTIITDQIRINHWFNGTFSLPGVINITGDIVCQWDGSYYSRQGVDAIEAPDLVYLGGLRLSQTGVRRMEFPALRTVDQSIELESFSDGQTIEFPALVEAGAVVLMRRFSRFNFGSLETVHGDLIIEQCTYCNEGHDVDPTEFTPNASFPVLQSAGFVRIEGIFSDINLPSLVSVGPPTRLYVPSTDSGITIHVKELGMELEFPALTAVNKQFYVHDAVLGLDMPALQHINGSFRIDASTPLSVDLPLISAEWLQLDGNIKEASFPALNTRTTSLRLDGISCGAMGPGLRDSEYYIDRCGEYKAPLSKGAKIAAGVVVPVGVLGIVILVIVWYKRRARRRGAKAVGEVGELVDLPPRGGAVDGGRDGGRGRVPVARPERERSRSRTPPPPYEARGS
ncbi:hypothetical protein BJX62DRAFT_234127 [Aspergillus germanicus]